MARRPTWHATLNAARSEAVLAVRLYNDSVAPRSFEGFVVHMHMAWLYLLHARLTRDGTEFRYRERARPRQFVRIDGEYKRWELAKCVGERWPDDHDPIRKNLEFFIALRNRFEHRHARDDVNIAVSFAGHAQAHLLNFEQELVTTFGSAHSLATTMRFPVFIGTFTTDGIEALRRLRSTLPADLRHFIAEFHDGLSGSTADDSRFELRLRVVLEQVGRDSEALAIQFTRWDDLTDQEKDVVERLGRRGQTIVREQKRPVVGFGLLRPQEAERLVAEAIPFRFNSNHFVRARVTKKLRPPTGDAHPERTDERYCIYDEFSRSYGYTQAWVNYLIKVCSTEQGFQKVTGRTPNPKALA